MPVICTRALVRAWRHIFPAVFSFSVKHCFSVICGLWGVPELAVASKCSWVWDEWHPSQWLPQAGNGTDSSVNYHSVAGWVECPNRSWGQSLALIFLAGSIFFHGGLTAAFQMAQLCCQPYYGPSTTSFPGLCVAQEPSVFVYWIARAL